MLRKIIIGGVITTLSAGLIYGGAYRTAARADSGDASRDGSGYGEGRYAGQNGSLDLDHENVQGNRNAQSNTGNRGNSSNGRASEDLVFTENDSYQTVTVAGTVADVTGDWMTIRLEDASEILIENRAWWYALDEGFAAAAGDAVQVTGFMDDDGKFESSMILNLTSGVEVEIREEVSGKPKWAGGNSSGGNRSGQS